MDEIPEEIWREGVGGRGEELGKVFGRCFNGRVSHCSKGLGRKEQLALVTPTVVVELTRKMLSTLRGGEEGKERERGGGWVGVNGLRKRRRNTIITSPQIYEDREIEIFVPRQARRRQAAARPPARGTEHFQLWHYNLLPVPRRMRAAATGTDYINLISSSLTVSTDPPPLPPSSVTIHPTPPPFRLFLARPGLGQSYVKRARLSAHHCLCKYQCEICAST